MPEILAMVQASVEVTSSIGASLVADVSVDNPDATNQVVADVEVDGAGGEAAESRTYQRAYFEIDIDNATLGDSNRIGAMRVSRSLNKTIQDAKFTVHLPNATGPIGNPFTHSGPATCKREVSIFGVYNVNGTEYRVPLISKGIGAVSERVASKRLVYESFDVLDRGARYDQARVSKRIPAGSGLNRDRVARIFAEEAEVEDIVFEQCSPTNRELAIAEGEWIGPVAEQCFDVELRKMLWNVFGDLYNPRFSAPSLHENVEPTVWVWGPNSFSDEHDIRVVWKNDIFTRAHLFGSAPVIKDGCPDEPTSTSRVTKDIYAPRSPSYTQGSGSYTANPQAPAPADPIRVRLEIDEKITRCGAVLYERTRVWTYYNPRAGRYTWDLINTEWDKIAGRYTDENSDGEENAYLYDKEQWLLTSVNERWHYYWQIGYRYGEHGINFGVLAGADGMVKTIEKLFAPTNGMIGTDGNPGPEYLVVTQPDGGGVFVGEQAGVKLGTITRNWRWMAPAKALKDRTLVPDDPWEDVPIANGLNVFGNKTAFVDNLTSSSPYFSAGYDPQGSETNGETFLLEEMVAEAFDINSDNFLTAKHTAYAQWHARDGFTFYYGERDIRSEEEETFRFTRKEEERYVAKTKESHDILRDAWDLDAQPLRSQSEYDVPGYLPAADFLPTEQGDSSLYQGEDEQSELQSVSVLTESQDLDVEVIADDLEICHFEKTYEGEYEHAENEDELERAGRAMIAEDAAGEFSATLAGANFYVREGQIAVCDEDRIGLETPYLIRIEDVEHSQDRPNGKILTSVKGKIYVW